MSAQHLIIEAEKLERQIFDASSDGRLRLQPQFNAVVRRLRAEGADVPRRLRRLDAKLRDEAIEARFDNLPV